MHRSLAIAALAVAGCSGSGSSEGPGSTGSTGATATSGSGGSTTDGSSSGSSGEVLDADVTLVNLNVLHGFFCPDPTGDCRLSERMDLFFEWIEFAGCPDVVTVQEASAAVQSLIKNRIGATGCGFSYRLSLDDFGIVDNLILSRYPVTASASFELFGGVDRHVQLARIDHPVGPVDVFTTHLASSVDSGGDPCEGAAACPTACVDAGALTIRDCEAVELAAVVADEARTDAVVLVSGDFNATAGSFAIEHLAKQGFVDTHLAAGNAECQPATTDNCTSGRSEAQLEQPAHNQGARIDFIFHVPGGAGCASVIEAAGDGDGDGAFTGPFAHLPNPFSPDCGPAPAAVCWPSDHDGNALDLGCQ